MRHETTTKPTEADRKRAAAAMFYTWPPITSGAAQDIESVATAIAVAREEGRQEIRAKVEALADSIATTPWRTAP